MRIIDIGAMLGWLPDQRERQLPNPEDLLAYMDRHCLTDAVVYHTDACRDTVIGNAETSAICQKYDRLRACYVIDPPLDSNTCGDADQLTKYLCENRPVAVRMFPKSQKVPFNTFYCGDILEVLQDLRMPLLMNVGEYTYEEVAEVAQNFPELRLVLLRPGLNRSRVTFPLLRKTKNVYFDISVMLDTGLLTEVVSKFGPERFLYSSCLPNFEPAGPLGLVMYADITDADRRAILAENWLALENGIAWKTC